MCTGGFGCFRSCAPRSRHIGRKPKSNKQSKSICARTVHKYAIGPNRAGTLMVTKHIFVKRSKMCTRMRVNDISHVYMQFHFFASCFSQSTSCVHPVWMIASIPIILYKRVDFMNEWWYTSYSVEILVVKPAHLSVFHSHAPPCSTIYTDHTGVVAL